jgi:hypothetical protein
MAGLDPEALMKPSVADILIFAKQLFKRAEFHYQQ